MFVAENKAMQTSAYCAGIADIRNVKRCFLIGDIKPKPYARHRFASSFTLKIMSAFIAACAIFYAVFSELVSGPDLYDASSENNFDQIKVLELVNSEKDQSGFGRGDALISNGEVYVSASSAILCTENGRLLFSQNADECLPMASITKVMTAIVVLENVSELSTLVTIDASAVGVEGSSLYLSLGDTVTVEHMLYALMLASANDCAVALACFVCGDEQSFVSLMNEKAAEIGMSNTSFKNPHGLNCEEHYTTARDYAKLMSYALKNETFREIIGTTRASVVVSGVVRAVSNHNRLLYSCKGMIGGKTGYTIASGRTLVTACERNGITLICVTLNASDDWNDHLKLYDVGFSRLYAENFDCEDLSVEVNVVGGKIGKISLKAECDIRVVCAYGESVERKYCYPRFVYAPIKSGEVCGKIEFYIKTENNGITESVKIGELRLIADGDVFINDNTNDDGIIKKLKNIFVSN